jgi:2,4-dienoyl-CoA reductase-like NADH-dependent reductase (Old Yellow Enzyme family)
MHFDLYAHWAHGGWGMVITGNVQLASDHLTLGRDMVLPRDITSPAAYQPFVQLAGAIHGKKGTAQTTDLNERAPLAIMQLSHGGRQSTVGLGGRIRAAPVAPSAVPVELKNAGARTSCSALLSRAMFQTPREMSLREIDDVVEGFVNGARLASKAGFDGVEIHAAHGCEWSCV